MIRHFGSEPPWRGRARMSGRVLWWVRLDDLWDGTPVWYLQDVRQPTIFENLMKRMITERVNWLEDDLLVRLSEGTPPA